MKLVRPLMLAASVLIMAGCQVAPTSKGADYSNLPPFDLRASAVLVDDLTAPSTDAGHIEGKITPSIGERVRTMVENHYYANAKGATGAPQLMFTVTEASVTETQLPVPESQLDRLLRNYADTRYEGRVAVSVDASSSGQFGKRGFAQAQSTRTLEVGNLTGEARNKYLEDMVQQMVGEVIVELDKQILANLGGLVNPTAMGATTVNGGDLTIVPQTSGRWDKMKNWE